MKTQEQKDSDVQAGNLQSGHSQEFNNENATNAGSNEQHTAPTLYLQAQQFAMAILADPILKDLYTRMAGDRCRIIPLPCRNSWPWGNLGNGYFKNPIW